MIKFLLVVPGVLFALQAAAGPGIANVAVDGNELSAEIVLPGGIQADLTLSFDQAIGLSAASTGLSAQLVDPSDRTLLKRFPLGEPVSIPSAFPVLLHIDPPATQGLSFTGVAGVELHTHALPYAADTPLRLFAASNGGPFSDISDSITSGSYRVRGSRGEFSEFMILADLRDIAAVTAEKFTTVRNTLDANQASITASTYAELDSLLVSARTAWSNTDYAVASDLIDDFVDVVRQRSGSEIPNVWRSSRDLVNVAGLLRAHAATLRLSLSRASNGLP